MSSKLINIFWRHPYFHSNHWLWEYINPPTVVSPSALSAHVLSNRASWHYWGFRAAKHPASPADLSRWGRPRRRHLAISLAWLSCWGRPRRHGSTCRVVVRTSRICVGLAWIGVTYSLIYSFNHGLSLIHSFTKSLLHWLTHSLNHSLTQCN